MYAKQFYKSVIDQATAVIMQVRDEDMHRQTPDTEWDTRKLAQHMLHELCWATDIINGKTITEVGDAHEGDLIDDDWQETWQDSHTSAHAAVDQASDEAVVHVSYGDVDLEQYLMQAGSDLLIHTWDMGEAINQPVAMDGVLAKAALDYGESNRAMIENSDLFGTPLDTPPDADLQTRLLALYGRSNDWRQKTNPS